jgi:16S rRNA (uracil1498-N3)-methyltransferase
MTVRAPISGLAEGERVLPAETSHYLCRVRRLGPGARFVGFDPDARLEADAEIVAVSNDGARVMIGPVRPAQVIAGAGLVLVYGLAKGDKVDDVVRDATELGATRVIITRTERAVVKATAERAKDKIDRWRRIAEQAARQSGRADPPTLIGVLDWPDALDQAADCEARFCLDPRAAEALGTALPAAIERGASVAFAIGPEGGLSSDEVEIAIAKGFLPASLGPFVHRTETVAAAVLGAVRVLATG